VFGGVGYISQIEIDHMTTFNCLRLRLCGTQGDSKPQIELGEDLIHQNCHHL